MKSIMLILLLCTSSVLAQEVIPLSDSQRLLLKKNNVIPKRENNIVKFINGDCTKPVFGFYDPLPNVSGYWGVKQGDVIGTWIVVPADGSIDTVYFHVGQNIGADSLVSIRLYNSNIGPHSGPGLPPYPPACTPWGYYFSQHLNKAVPWKASLYPEDDTSWHSTVPIEENSFSPHRLSIFDMGYVPPVRVKPGINKLDLEGTGFAPDVKKGDVIFIDIQPLGVPSESSFTQFYFYEDETKSDSTPASTWIFYNNPIPGWPNCDTISNPPPGWYARSNYQPGIWIHVQTSSNTPPIIKQVVGGDARNTFSTNPISIEYDIYDCNYDTPAVAGVASAFIRWWKMTDLEYLPQQDILMSPTGIGDRWIAEIPRQEQGTAVQYQVVARDSAGLESIGPQINFKIVTLKNKYYWIDTNYSCINKSIANSGSIITYTSFFVPPSTNPLSNPWNDGTAGPFDIGSSFQFFGDTTLRPVAS
ncbi:MAG: hypothetical protein HY964_09745 [Ignavibacteriales bacterium]|nr:hypothetical protein [Ignavibacteriales bacterium]